MRIRVTFPDRIELYKMRLVLICTGVDSPFAYIHHRARCNRCTDFYKPAFASHPPPRALQPHFVADLYTDSHPWLCGWLHRRLGNASDAADLTHDTFVRLIASGAQQHFDSIAQARAYLRTTAQNLCINRWRRQEVERAWLDTLAATPEEHHPSAERQIIVLQALEEISAMLHSLSPKAARAFTLAVMCDMSDAEVGAEMGISGRMVRKYVAQAMTACLTLRTRQTVLELRQEHPF